MAAHSGDSEHFRRRVQQKLAERWTEEMNHEEDTEKDKDKRPSPKKSPFNIQNFIWLAVAISVFYFSDFLSVIVYDSRIRRTWFWIGLAAIAVHVGIASFLVLWLNAWKKIDTEEWEKMYPKAVPVATASFICGALCLSISLWPVWGFFTPLILGALFMGAIVIVAMFG